jgi:hypothetical protein
MFRSILRLSPKDTLAAVYLTTGKIAPAHEGIELNIGGAAVCDAIVQVTGISKARIHSAYQDMGDLGDVAQVKVLKTAATNPNTLPRARAQTHTRTHTHTHTHACLQANS